jgi:glycosyltransferase involved in cell wall biosynthesis
MLKHDAYVAVGAGQKKGFPVVLRPEGAGETGDLAWQKKGNFGQKIGRRTKEANAFVAISRSVEDELRAAGYDRERIHRLPNGVPIPEPIWQRRDDWRHAPRAVFVGRLAPEKGIETLIEAWVKVREARPTALLRLVGDGPERAILEAGVGKLGLGDAVEFTGVLSDVEGQLRAADLFILPSREEGMSIALLEAMALGMPILATNIPGNRKLITDFKNGRLVEPGDPEAMARVVLEQWGQADRSFHMSRFARQKVQAEFSIGAMARSHLDLFRQVIAGGGPSC